MLLKRSGEVDEIIKRITLLQYYVRLRSKKGWLDTNKDCEDFFAGLLNRLYGWNLKNLNKKIKNHPVIDLGDDKNRVAIQVTSTIERKKIKDTVNDFERHQFYKRYKKLVVFIIGEKPDYQPSKKVKSYQCEVQDIFTLVDDIISLESDELKDIHDYVVREINVPLLNSLNEEEYFFSKKVNTFKPFQNGAALFLHDTPANEKANSIQDLIVLGKRLEQLSLITRHLLTALIQSRTTKEHDHIYFNPKEIVATVGDHEGLSQHYSILVDRNFVTSDEEHLLEGVVYEQVYCKGFDYDIILDIVNFCEKHTISLDKILIDLDFTVLD